MTQPPYDYGSGWESGGGAGAAPPPGPPPYGPPPYGQPPYGPPPYGQPYGPPYPPGYAPPGYGGAPYYPPAPPPAPTPGSIPLRPLGLGDILDGSFKLIRRNPKVMLGLSAAVAVIQMLLVVIVELVVFAALSDVTVTSSSDPTAETNLGPLFGSDAALFVTVIVSSLLGAVLTGMLTVAITQDILGVRLSVSEVWTRTKGRIWPLIGLATVTWILEVLGLIPCLTVGIWLWGIWAVAVPALMVENTTIRGALSRSRRLVTGTFWRVWGIRALGFLISSVIGGFISAPFTIVGLIVDSGTLSSNSSSAALPVAYVVLASIGSAVSATFTAPIRAGIDALLYVDLRMRKEGLDIVLQQAAAKTGPYAGPAVPKTAF